MNFATMYAYQASSSSSSSSSPSGIVTPVDDHPHLFPTSFPRFPLTRNQSSSSESSQSYGSRSRPRFQSFSKPSVASVPSRPRRLSVDCTKASVISAAASVLDDQAPSGSFSHARSAEGHLRSLIGSPTPRSTISGEESEAGSKTIPLVVSLKRHTRALSLRSLPFTWTQKTTSAQEDEKDSFRQGTQTHVSHKNPSITRDDASRQTALNGADNVPVPNLRTRYAHSRAASSPSPPSLQRSAGLQKPRPHRASTFSGTPAQPRAVATLRFPDTGRPGVVPQVANSSSPRVFLKPKSSGKASIHAAAVANASKALRPSVAGAPAADANVLDPALAAVENSSRFRAKCVCGVCGKMGVDYPRCARCPATW